MLSPLSPTPSFPASSPVTLSPRLRRRTPSPYPVGPVLPAQHVAPSTARRFSPSPPPHMLNAFVAKARADGARAVLVTPLSVSAPYWNKLLRSSVVPNAAGYYRVRRQPVDLDHSAPESPGPSMIGFYLPGSTGLRRPGNLVTGPPHCRITSWPGPHPDSPHPTPAFDQFVTSPWAGSAPDSDGITSSVTSPHARRPPRGLLTTSSRPVWHGPGAARRYRRS